MQVSGVLSPGLGAGSILSTTTTLLGDFRCIFPLFSLTTTHTTSALGQRSSAPLDYSVSGTMGICSSLLLFLQYDFYERPDSFKCFNQGSGWVLDW